MTARAAKRLTRTQIQALMASTIDTRTDKGGGWKDECKLVAETCRWLDRAATLYGRRRVEALLRGALADDAPIWAGYWKRWRAREERHVVPRLVLIDPRQASAGVAMRIALAPRVAA